MNKDLVSIIIPFYKVEDYLNYVVESVVNQSYKNLEIILVDDGSPDDCPKLCDEWAKKDGRIRVIHKKNGGLSDARNAGLDIATGEYIVFLDGDDKMDVDAISILYKTLKKYDANVVMTDYYHLTNIEENPIIDKSDYQEEFVEGNEVFNLVFNKKYPMIMLSWGKMYKKELFNEIRFPQGKIHEDDFIIHRILAKTKRFVHIDTKLFLNSLRPGSITASKFNKKRLDAIDAKVDRVLFCKEYKPEYYQTAIRQFLRTIMINYTFARMSNLNKEDYKYLNELYNENYKTLKKKDILTTSFRYCRNITYLALRIYVKKKKLLFNK